MHYYQSVVSKNYVDPEVTFSNSLKHTRLKAECVLDFYKDTEDG